MRFSSLQLKLVFCFFVRFDECCFHIKLVANDGKYGFPFAMPLACGGTHSAYTLVAIICDFDLVGQCLPKHVFHFLRLSESQSNEMEELPVSANAVDRLIFTLTKSHFSIYFFRLFLAPPSPNILISVVG